MVVIRTTWDYTGRRDAFVDWAQRVEDVTTLWNPAEVVRWNTHKSYLIELEERGAPVVPTAWLGQGDRVDLPALLRSRGWPHAIVKPAVDVGGDRLIRVAPETVELAQHHLDAILATGDAMVQPELTAVQTEGELSVIFIDGQFSHAVNKRPAPGEIRVHIERGGRYESVLPDEDTLALARWILEVSGHEYLFARVDLIPDASGTPQLAELEVTEPSLYLFQDETAAGRLADAITARLPG